ncbi:MULTISPECIES: sigma-70 family RNA polymerase sigma factor [unclassified Kitasatospora]|uniref:sigma-70 family RNA polymerase sigma factor n=1 Tax=unclassified Kitasatospora TaxID=2633591 RepID=UPI002475CD6B|nr:sigma-70 family RNA polymerase sigma factor [Kitasatospora sp. MAP12-44]
MHGASDAETVAAAQAGDAAARERLIADHLPLLYNVVGRALDGHADVDDVVQETMLRVVHSLDGLREPSSFRSWLVAVAMNEIRRRWAARQAAPVPGLQEMTEVTDPAADFVDLTILRLGLSGQRREVAEATRWLDERERDLLALWWLEASGELTRAELAAALDLTPQHAAVRVQRMKEQLDTARAVVRALAMEPRCAELAVITSGWDGQPGALWRKRTARHLRGCPYCSGHCSDLVPVEGLLAGLPLLLPPSHLAAFTPTAAQLALPHAAAAHPGAAAHTAAATHPGSVGHPAAAAHPGAPAHGAGVPRPRRRLGGHRPVQLVGAVALSAAAVLGVVQLLPSTPSKLGPVVPDAASAPPSSAAATPSLLPPPAPASSAPATVASLPSAPAAATASPSRSAAPRSLEQQLIDLINLQRGKAGCGPLRVDPRLHAAAQGHSDEMAADGYFDHVDPRGGQAADRMTAAGYPWTMWGENLDKGTSSPAGVVKDWTDDAVHQENMLNCQYADAGVGTASSSGGMLWTLDLGRAD